MKPTAPCLGCKERHGGCWADCERYQRFKDDHAEHKAKIQKQKERESLLDGYNAQQYCRNTGTKERQR